jgi:hypothetical protein
MFGIWRITLHHIALRYWPGECLWKYSHSDGYWMTLSLDALYDHAQRTYELLSLLLKGEWRKEGAIHLRMLLFSTSG